MGRAGRGGARVRSTGVVKGFLGRKRTISVGKNTERIDNVHYFLPGLFILLARKTSGGSDSSSYTDSGHISPHKTATDRLT